MASFFSIAAIRDIVAKWISAPDPGENFVEASKNSAPFPRAPTVPAKYRDSTLGLVKLYEGIERIPLPEPQLPETSLKSVLLSRRTWRDAARGVVNMGNLSSLLHSAYGVTGENKSGVKKLRTAPSGGALFPLELYWISQKVEGLANGVYHYNPLLHSLDVITQRGVEPTLASVFIQPEMQTGKIGYLIITGVFWRNRVKYGLRGCRFVFLEAGHVAQNFLLAAESLSLGTVPLGGFYDAKMDELLGVDGLNETAIYGVAVD